MGALRPGCPVHGHRVLIWPQESNIDRKINKSWSRVVFRNVRFDLRLFSLSSTVDMDRSTWTGVNPTHVVLFLVDSTWYQLSNPVSGVTIGSRLDSMECFEEHGSRYGRIRYMVIEITFVLKNETARLKIRTNRWKHDLMLRKGVFTWLTVRLTDRFDRNFWKFWNLTM